MVEISPDLACFCRIWSDFFVAPVGSGYSGFGDVNSSLDPPMSVFENKNPPSTDWTFGSGRNRVVVGRFGRVVGLWSGLDSPIDEKSIGAIVEFRKVISKVGKVLKFK